MVCFSFPKKSAFSHIAQIRVKLVLTYSVDHVELIEPQEAVVLMIFRHFKILRSIFSCNFGPFLEGLNFFFASVKNCSKQNSGNLQWK